MNSEKEQKENRRQVFIVKGIVKKEKGDFLLVKREREWDKKTHGKWELPGGKVEFGEEPKEAVIREVKEETGYEISNPEPLPYVHSHVWNYENRSSQVIIIPYRCSLEDGSPSTEDKNISDVKWFNRKEIDSLECIPGTKRFLEENRS